MHRIPVSEIVRKIGTLEENGMIVLETRSGSNQYRNLVVQQELIIKQDTDEYMVKFATTNIPEYEYCIIDGIPKLCSKCKYMDIKLKECTKEFKLIPVSEVMDIVFYFQKKNDTSDKKYSITFI